MDVSKGDVVRIWRGIKHIPINLYPHEGIITNTDPIEITHMTTPRNIVEGVSLEEFTKPAHSYIENKSPPFVVRRPAIKFSEVVSEINTAVRNKITYAQENCISFARKVIKDPIPKSFTVLYHSVRTIIKIVMVIFGVFVLVKALTHKDGISAGVSVANIIEGLI